MDEFYIVRLWISDQYWDLVFCQTLDYAKSILQKEVEKRRATYSEEYDTWANCRFIIHRMARLDKFTGALYVEVSDSELVECPNCHNVIKFKEQWVSYSDELAQSNSNGEYCGHCYDRVSEIERSRNEQLANLDKLSRQPEWNIVANLIKQKLGVEIIDVDKSYLHVKGIFRENTMVKLPHWLVSEILRSWR